MSRQNFSVARMETRTRDSIGKYERHNERKNEHYGNMNVDLSRTPMNAHFKSCGDMTYNETLDKLIHASLSGVWPAFTARYRVALVAFQSPLPLMERASSSLQYLLAEQVAHSAAAHRISLGHVKKRPQYAGAEFRN